MSSLIFSGGTTAPAALTLCTTLVNISISYTNNNSKLFSTDIYFTLLYFTLEDVTRNAR